MLISKETLEGLRIGELTDKQLDEAIEHYTLLEKLLLYHGERYHLVWKDVKFELMRRESYELSRNRRKKEE